MKTLGGMVSKPVTLFLHLTNHLLPAGLGKKPDLKSEEVYIYNNKWVYFPADLLFERKEISWMS